MKLLFSSMNYQDSGSICSEWWKCSPRMNYQGAGSICSLNGETALFSYENDQEQALAFMNGSEDVKAIWSQVVSNLHISRC